jgi:hypothetical protein
VIQSRVWNLRVSKEGIMKVEVTVRIDEQKVATVQEEIGGRSSLEVEEQARRVLQRVGGAILERALEQVAQGTPAPMCCGRAMENRGYEGLTIHTTCGGVYQRRRRYRCRVCHRTLFPADVELCCGHHRVSRALAKRVCQLATVEHFTRLEQLLADQHGVHLSREELVDLVHDVGAVAEQSRRAEVERNPDKGSRPAWPAAEIRPPRVYVSCDGIMYCTNLSEPDPQNPGRRRLLWQQMKVGCVYWQNEAGDWRKQMVWGRESPEEFGATLFRLACRCGYREAAEKVFSADGADWCWEIQARYFSDATGILDWYHASEHLWAAGRLLFPEARLVRQWVEEAQGILWEHGAERLIDWLTGQEAKFCRSRKKRGALTGLRKYVQNREWLMDYPKYRTQKFQIGTGMMESTARQLVGLRLKGPGMHWTEQGALAVTALRAQDLNGRWHTFWKNLILVS